MVQAESTSVPGFVPRWFTRTKTVTRPGTNRLRRRVTTLIETTRVLLLYRYVTWSAGVEVRVGRVSDGSLVARTSTHETLTCLDCSIDAGYVVVAGRNDGHLLTMKLLLDDDQRLSETTASDAEERRRILLHQLVSNWLTTTYLLTRS